MKALFVLPEAQSCIDDMVETLQRDIDVAKRKLKYAKSIKTQNQIAQFGVLAMSANGRLNAYVGSRYVPGDWKNGEYCHGEYIPQVNARIRIDNLESFKDERLIRILEAIDGAGLEAKTNDCTYSENPNREFTFETDDYRLVIDAYVKSDSPSCKRVKVGETTRTIVDEQWALECSE